MIRRPDLNKIVLTLRIYGQQFCPYKCQQSPEFACGRLQQLEDVRKDADGERKSNGPRAEVEETAQKFERAFAMLLKG